MEDLQQVLERLTEAQVEALVRVTQRWHDADSASFQKDKPATWTELAARGSFAWGAFMVPFGPMWLGIEPDGYTHS